jgi:sortase (surface protein transpeptidase)
MKKLQKKVVSRVLYAFLAVFLVLIGSGLVFASSFDFVNSSARPAKMTQIAPINEYAKPAKLHISKLDRNLDVSDGYFEDNRWVISKTGVSYLITSAKLGQVDNVVLYGHNTRDVLGGLWRLQNGDIVEITGTDGRLYKYEIFERREVKANALEILESTPDARLTLFTCSGFLDTARFVVVGKLIESS